MYGWEFPPHISGGLGVACFDLTKSLSELGVDITFVLPVLKSAPDSALHLNLIGSANIPVDTQLIKKTYLDFLSSHNIVEVETLLHPYINEKLYKCYLETLEQTKLSSENIQASYNLNLTGHYGPDLLGEVFRYAHVAGFIAKQVPHDIIHAHDWLTVLAGIHAKHISAKPLIYHVHALETDRSGKNLNNDVYKIEKFGLEQADKIIAVSYFTKNNIVSNYGIDPHKIEVVHNAVSKSKQQASAELFKIRKNPQEKIILFLGRVTYQKGPDYFLEAAAKVLRKTKNVRFVVAGVGDMICRLIDRAAQLKIGRNVHFTGFLNRAQVEALLAASDVYVMSSVSEPFGISSLEAVLFDVPVIVSKQSGVTEVLKHSLKVDFWDTDELANKIYSLIKYPALGRELNARAAEELKHIQWEKSARHVFDIYKSMTGTV
jgi:glycosyltransferase involved in cell wall biosynthesis